MMGPYNKPPESTYYRTSGDCLCKICNKEYWRHPMDMFDLGYDNTPFLHVLCDGTRVKL